MTEVRRIARPLPTLPDMPELELKGWEYLTARVQADKFTKEMNERKAELLELLEEQGENVGDHRELRFPTIAGGDYSWAGFQRQKRVSTTFDEEAAMALVKKKHLEDKCLTSITVLDEDELLAANMRNEISDEEIDALYGSSEPTYAFVPLKS